MRCPASVRLARPVSGSCERALLQLLLAFDQRAVELGVGHRHVQVVGHDDGDVDAGLAERPGPVAGRAEQRDRRHRRASPVRTARWATPPSRPAGRGSSRAVRRRAGRPRTGSQFGIVWVVRGQRRGMLSSVPVNAARSRTSSAIVTMKAESVPVMSRNSTTASSSSDRQVDVPGQVRSGLGQPLDRGAAFERLQRRAHPQRDRGQHLHIGVGERARRRSRISRSPAGSAPIDSGIQAPAQPAPVSHRVGQVGACHEVQRDGSPVAITARAAAPIGQSPVNARIVDRETDGTCGDEIVAVDFHDADDVATHHVGERGSAHAPPFRSAAPAFRSRSAAGSGRLCWCRSGPRPRSRHSARDQAAPGRTRQPPPDDR